MDFPPAPCLIAVLVAACHRSHNPASTMRKLQYWRKQDGRWRIFCEGPA